MELVSKFLEKHSKIKPPDDVVRRALCGAVLDVIGEKIDISDVSYKRGIFYIKAGPALKSEINLKRDRILGCVSEKLTTAVPQKII